MKKNNMERVKQTEYEITILKPLRDAIEKAGGRLALAKKIGVSTSNLTGMLSGKHIMKIPTLMKICNAVGITLLFVDTMSETLKIISNPWPRKYVTPQEVLDLIPDKDKQ